MIVRLTQIDGKLPNLLQEVRRVDRLGQFPAPRGFRGRRPKVIDHPNRSEKNRERAVLVTTTHRGVFFGYANKTDGATIQMRSARNCIYWSSDVKGFLGLASTGPSKNCKIGPAADIELRDITCVAECTPEAIAAWEGAPWSR